MKMRIKKLNDNAVIPTYGSASAAGADLYSCEGEITIAPGETRLVHTGLSMQIPEGYVGLIYARSGIATKRGVAPANKVGVIDSDYRGEIMVALHNHSKVDAVIAEGEIGFVCKGVQGTKHRKDEQGDEKGNNYLLFHNTRLLMQD